MTLDFTEAFGGVHYNNRTITLVFLSLEPWNDQMTQDSTVKNALHGKKMKIAFSDDPGYYWIGRVNVGGWEYYKGAGRVEVTINADPFKYHGNETVLIRNVGNNANLYQYYDSFETITDDTIASRITGDMTASIVSSGAKAGSKALSLHLNSGDSGAVVLGLDIESKNYGRQSLVPGYYIASIFAKVSQNTPATVSFSVNAYAGQSATSWQYRQLRAQTSVTVEGSTWQRIVLPFTIAKNSVFHYASLRLEVGTTDVDVVFDCAMIELVDSATATPSAWTAATINSAITQITLSNNGAKALVPFVSASSNILLTWSNYSINIGAGNDKQIPQLVLEGNTDTVIRATGAALLSFRYQEASL